MIPVLPLWRNRRHCPRHFLLKLCTCIDMHKTCIFRSREGHLLYCSAFEGPQKVTIWLGGVRDGKVRETLINNFMFLSHVCPGSVAPTSTQPSTKQWLSAIRPTLFRCATWPRSCPTSPRSKVSARASFAIAFRWNRAPRSSVYTLSCCTIIAWLPGSLSERRWGLICGWEENVPPMLSRWDTEQSCSRRFQVLLFLSKRTRCAWNSMLLIPPKYRLNL